MAGKPTQQEAAKFAQEIWQQSAQKSEVPYLKSKGLGFYQGPVLTGDHRIAGMSFKAGDLIVPLYDFVSGELVNLQLINSDGGKRFLPGGQVKNAGFLLGGNEHRIWIAEGFSTGLTIRQCTGDSVIVAFSVTQLAAATAAAEMRFPTSELIIAADNDQSTTDNVGKTTALEVARKHGISVTLPPALGDWNDHFVANGEGETLKALEKGRSMPSAELGLTLTAQSTEDAREIDTFPVTFGSRGYDPKVSFLVDDFIPANCVGVLYAPPGHYKTFLALAIACHLAAGIGWDGKEPKQGSVLYIAAEGGNGILRRVEAWQRKHYKGRQLDALALVRQKVSVTDASDMKRLKATVREIVAMQGPLVLIVIDTLARCFAGADENKTPDMNRFVAACDELCLETGASVLVVHHCGKDPSKGARGNSSLYGAVEFEYVAERCQKNGNDAVMLHCSKMKDGPEPEDVCYPLEKVEWSESDELLSSLVVVPHATEVPVSSAKKPLSERQQDVIDAIKHLDELGEQPTKNAVRDVLKAKGIEVQNFSRWINQLVSAQKLRLDGDVLVLT